MNLPSKILNAERHDPDDHLRIGEWFWVVDDAEKHPPSNAPDPKYGWFGCISKVGSNYIKIEEPDTKDGGSVYDRIHFDDVDERLLWEPHPEKVIGITLANYQLETSQLIGEVKAITALLGVSQTAIAHHEGAANGSGQELAILSDAANPEAHKQELIKAKDETLPELFAKIKQSNFAVAKWMAAEMTPLLIEAGELNGAISHIEKRIFGISLYAGLTEEVVQVREGDPGLFEDRVHLMQRMMYMDEECLANYKAGGMDIKGIDKFDEWLSEPENMERCLPFNKCVTLFRVRRNVKDRQADSNIQAYINVELAELDKCTFMYIRNGSSIYRLNTDIDFDEKMFPDVGAFDLDQPMMSGRGHDLMTKMEWDHLNEEWDQTKKLIKKWKRDNPIKKWEKEHPGKDWSYANPHFTGHFESEPHSLSSYDPFDATNVYYDDIMKGITDEMERFNRVSLIMQGLLDRSPILHPHPKAETWTQEGFELIFKLVYDAAMVLTYGEAPSFEDYREKINTLADADSVFIGQQDFWSRKEAVKENNRRDNDWRDRSEYRVEHYTPYGNPGPDYVAKPTKWHHRVHKATFTWERERQNYAEQWRGGIKTHIVVHLDNLFNVSEYKPGDFKQFFADPRTRRDYIKWAPFLLGAEDYYVEKKK